MDKGTLEDHLDEVIDLSYSQECSGYCFAESILHWLRYHKNGGTVTVEGFVLV